MIKKKVAPQILARAIYRNEKTYQANAAISFLKKVQVLWNQVPKEIVIALMAAPNCPWSEKKRASRSNTTKKKGALISKVRQV